MDKPTVRNVDLVTLDTERVTRRHLGREGGCADFGTIYGLNVALGELLAQPPLFESA